MPACAHALGSPPQAMWVPALLLPLLLLALLALLPASGTADPGQPCPSEMNKVKDLLELNCTEQGLSTVPPHLPKDMGILLLSANRLTTVSMATFLPFRQLQDLDLSYNGLVALHTGALLPSLRELILSHNALEALPTLQGLPALTLLAVANNSLATLAPTAFLNVQRLQDLDLRGNKLRTLPHEVFAGLRELKDLDLSDNLLEELPKELLQDLENLETLWLSGNRLQTLPTDFFPEGHLFGYVFLTENPWHCDCDLRYLRSWIWENNETVYHPERSVEKTKVQVAPEKVLCHSPPREQQKPIIYFKPSCGSVGDADEEEEEYERGDWEVTLREATTIAFFPPHPSEPRDDTAMPHAVTRPPLPATRPPLSTPCSSTLTPSTSTQPQTTAAASTSITFTTLAVSTGASSPTSAALPSTATPETSSTAGSSAPALKSAAPVISSTESSTHAPTPPAPLDITRSTQPPPSPPPALVPLCPCPGVVIPLLRSQAAGEGPQGWQWVLRHCCQLHWVLYLASVVLLVLTVLALAGWLVWMCLLRRPFWHQRLQNQEVQPALLTRNESTGSPAMHLSSFQNPLQRTTFCTIKEVELCPEVTYCTFKDLGVQHSPPASSSFRTTKELWVHQGSPNASFKPFSRELMVTNLSSQKAPSAYSLDRGITAIGDVRVKYADSTL